MGFFTRKEKILVQPKQETLIFNVGKTEAEIILFDDSFKLTFLGRYLRSNVFIHSKQVFENWLTALQTVISYHDKDYHDKEYTHYIPIHRIKEIVTVTTDYFVDSNNEHYRS